MTPQPSCGLPTTSRSRPWRYCWTAAPVWRARTRSAHRLRQRHVAPVMLSGLTSRPAALRGAVGVLLGWRGRELALVSDLSRTCAGKMREEVITRPWTTSGCVVAAGMRVEICRMAGQRSCGRPGTAKWRPWRCCWTVAPIWMPRTRSARRLRHRHVAQPAWFEVAQRPTAVPGVVGLLLGRRSRERAPRSGVSGARVGRERVWVDCQAVADVAVCWRGWYACCALQDGTTALMMAAQNGKGGVMASLLERGADLEARDNVSSSAAPLPSRPAGVVRGRDAAISSAGSGRPAVRATGSGARTGEWRVRGLCRAGNGLG